VWLPVATLLELPFLLMLLAAKPLLAMVVPHKTDATMTEKFSVSLSAVHTPAAFD
jgi:hypothetical protein